MPDTGLKPRKSRTTALRSNRSAPLVGRRNAHNLREASEELLACFRPSEGEGGSEHPTRFSIYLSRSPLSSPPSLLSSFFGRNHRLCFRDRGGWGSGAGRQPRTSAPFTSAKQNWPIFNVVAWVRHCHVAITKTKSMIVSIETCEKRREREKGKVRVTNRETSKLLRIIKG